MIDPKWRLLKWQLIAKAVRRGRYYPVPYLGYTPRACVI